MNYKNLGNTGLKVSPLCLGCMTFGVPERGDHPWTLPESQSRPLIRKAIDLGINFFDTANAYSDGTSEEIVGQALRDYSRRDEVVIATKVFFPMSPGPNGGGLSRKAIFTAIDASLRRLGTDYVDLYQIHRWDYRTPIEETLEALHDVVKSGKVRYLGASSMFAWQFSKCLHLARRHGWTPFVSMQNLYNLIYREEEREMLPLCADAGIAVLPWSPLARGRLTREWNTETERTRTDVLRRETVPLHGRDRSQGGRSRRRRRIRARSSPGAGRPLVADSKTRRDGTDHRRRENAASGRCRRGIGDRAHRRRDGAARSTLCSARGDRARMSAPACAIP